MADLDDFFAKKDRKKAKGGKKFTTTDEIAKKLEETGKRAEKIKLKEKQQPEEEEEVVKQKCIQEDDEWREFEEEKKDYTGLKIGNLAVNEGGDGESDRERGAGDNNSDGEAGESIVKNRGPWKNPQLPEQKEAEVASTSETSTTTTTTTTTTTSSYKAPHLRNVSSTNVPRSRLRNQAPDINSEEYFPTLSGKQQSQSGDNTGQWGRRKRDEGNFEEVRNRGGSRSYGVQDSHETQAPKLSLGNKYGALSQDQS